MHDTYSNMQQNAKEKQEKKYTTKLARTKPKKDEQTQGKKPTQKKNLF